MPDLISHPEVDQQILWIPGQARNDIRNTEIVMPDLISHPEVDQQILWIPGQARNDIRNTEKASISFF